MRPHVLLIVLGAATLGGASARVLGSAAGLVGSDTATVVVERRVSPAAGGHEAVPVLGNGCSPLTIYARRAPGVVTIYADLGVDRQTQGSGFVVDAKGTILTNAHVVTNVAEAGGGAVEGAGKLFVELRDRDRVPATTGGWDLFSDVAVVRVDPRDQALAPVPLGSSAAVVVGPPVAAIGRPFNEQSSLSVGIVSAVERTIDSLTSGCTVADAIQTDAPINHGTSGAPLRWTGPRDRDQRSDPLHERCRGGDRARGSDRHRETGTRATSPHEARVVRVDGDLDVERDARDRKALRPCSTVRGSGRQGRARHSGRSRRASRRQSERGIQRASVVARR